MQWTFDWMNKLTHAKLKTTGPLWLKWSFPFMMHLNQINLAKYSVMHDLAQPRICKLIKYHHKLLLYSFMAPPSKLCLHMYLHMGACGYGTYSSLDLYVNIASHHLPSEKNKKMRKSWKYMTWNLSPKLGNFCTFGFIVVLRFISCLEGIQKSEHSFEAELHP